MLTFLVKKRTVKLSGMYIFEDILPKKKKKIESNLILESENLSLPGRVQRENQVPSIN